MNRRNFFRLGAGGAIGLGREAWAQRADAPNMALVADPADTVFSSPEARWAAGELESALVSAGYSVRKLNGLGQLELAERAILIYGAGFPAARTDLQAAGISMPSDPESLALLPVGGRGQNILASGRGSRGLVYALLELADRVRSLPRAEALRIEKPIVETPANRVRSVMRQFTSEALDKPWFYDREMWPHYLTMLAAQRFNRFNLTFGLGYDSLEQVADSYLLFLYPFLLAVPGYDVRATNLPNAERDRNLETLRFISEQTVARGIDFELGIWMHGYRWATSSRARIRHRRPHPGEPRRSTAATRSPPCCAPARRFRPLGCAFTARAASPRAATISGGRFSTAWRAAGARWNSTCTPRASTPP